MEQKPEKKFEYKTVEEYNYEEAKAVFEDNYPRALQGNSYAMEYIAILYHLGNGVEQDYVKAAEWADRVGWLCSGQLHKKFLDLYGYFDEELK